MESNAGSNRAEREAPEAVGSGERARPPSSVPVAAELAPQARTPLAGVRVGQLIDGKYRLVKRLAEGGMGTVWLAQNEALEVEVAVKVLRSELADPHLEERLLTEARAAARLNHPGIVRVSDFGRTEAGDPYIVMELLEGDDLGRWLQREGRATPAVVLPMLLPVIHALALVHEKGIVHRDLKPENIVLSTTANDRIQPKIVDFGIAKLDGSGAERVTHAGAAIGSPAYMSPEQARGLEVDARCDIWAISVVLYEVLTGELPFNGSNHNALLYKVMGEDPKPITEWGAGDEALWAIVARGLAKDPAERWQCMRDLGTALSDWLLAQGVREDICGTALEAIWGAQARTSEDHGPGERAPLDRSGRSTRPVAASRQALPSEPAPPAPLARVRGSRGLGFARASGIVLTLIIAASGVILGAGWSSGSAARAEPPPALSHRSPEPAAVPSAAPGEPLVVPVLPTPVPELWVAAATAAPDASAPASARRRPAKPRRPHFGPRTTTAKPDAGHRPPTRVDGDELELKTRL